MIRSRQGPGVAFLLLGLQCGSLAAQSPVGLRPPGGAVGASFTDDSWTEAGPYGIGGRREWQEWVRLRLSLFLLDPRLVRFEGQVQPTRRQTVFRGATDGRGDGATLQGSGDLFLLGNRTVNAVLSGRRFDGSVNGRFGEDSRFLEKSWRASLFDRDPIFPTQIFYEDRILDIRRIAQPSLLLEKRDERTRWFRFDARNPKTGIQAERLQYEEGQSELAFVRRTGSIDHRLRWGKGSRLETALAYVDRSGIGPFRQFSWSESARLQHYQRLWSEYHYDFSRESVDGLKFQAGRANVAWEAAEWLQVSLTGTGRDRDFRSVRQRYAHVYPTARLALPLPAGARLAATLSLGYEWHSQEARQDVYYDVLQEPHTVDASGRFRLEKPFADPASLVVTSADGRELYRDGIDFRAVASGPFVDVFVLPASRIAEGDGLLVDYRVRAEPAADGNAWTQSIDTRLGLGPVDLYHRRFRTVPREDVPAGALPTLQQLDQSATGLALRWSGRRLSAGAAAERGRNQSRLYDNVYETLGGSAGMRLGRFSLQARGDWTRSRNERVQDVYTAVRGQATADWRIREGLLLSGFLAQWSWERNTAHESMVSAGGSLEWRFGRVLLDARFDRVRWVNGLDRTQDRLSASLTREF